MSGIRISKRSTGLTLAIAAALGAASLVWVLQPPKPGARTRRARGIIEGLKGMPMSPLRLEPSEEARAAETVTPADVLTPTADLAVRVTLPGKSTAPLHVQDAKTGLAVNIQAKDVFDVVAQSADGYFVYPHAHASGGTLLHRELEDGAEDFVSFETRPGTPEVDYQIALEGVHAVRLVENTLELLDADGTPRLRAAPPYIVGADGLSTDATVAVENCAVDTSPAAPWGRDLKPPGADSCTLRITWNDERVRYPAVLDPRWLSTTNMTTARQDYTATMMSTGKVLAVGGHSTSTSTTGFATAELFDPTTNTWATTASLTGTSPGRYLHTAVQLGSTSSSTTTGKVFVAGGTTAGASLNTAQLYSPSAGTWVAATNLNVARHGATATLLSNGNVLLAAGISGTTVQNTAAVYNPSSGGGTYTATNLMPQAVKFHTATLLKISTNTTLNNKVVVVGGNSGTASVPNVQLFDGTSSWSSLTALSSAREAHAATALANGNVLVTAGRSTTATPNTLATTLLYNVASGSGSWSSAGNLNVARQVHTATLLPSAIVEAGEQVVVAGGSSGSAPLTSTELWNGTNTWTTTTALPSALQGQTATLLNNNLILLAGGSNGTTSIATSVVFDGSFALQCTSNSQCQTGFCVNGVCCDTACNGGCGACNLTGKVGTCSAVSNTTVCRAQNGACDVQEKCDGTSLACPSDAVAPLGTVCRSAAGECDLAETCDGSTKACPADAKKASGTVCTDDGNSCTKDQCDGTDLTCQHPVASDGTACNDGNPDTVVDLCRSGTCIGTADPVSVLGFEELGEWSFSTGGGTVVGLNSNHTQGTHSLEVAVQNYQSLVSLPMATVPSVGPQVLLDVLAPSAQANEFWVGDVQMFINAPSVGIYNQYLGITELTGLPLATWQTLAFQLNSQELAALGGSFDDLTFTIVINVPATETGHYLLDNLRFSQPITPVLLGIATDSFGVTKALFSYTSSNTSTVLIPYGPANALSDQDGFIEAPLELPPTQFVPNPTTTFVATMSGSQLTWTIEGNSVTATPNSTPLPTTTGTDGTTSATTPNGSVPLDAGETTALANTVVATDTSYTEQDGINDIVLSEDGQPTLGPMATGAVPGSFRVTDDGAAEYVLHIVTPKGRRGVEPNLSLVYNSRKGDGFLGHGWSLQGIGRITRCATPFAVSNETGQDPSPIDTDTDSKAFCLDGERLVSIGTNEYRLKKDVGTRILVTGNDAFGPTGFQAFLRNGMIETYGPDDSSRTVLPQQTQGPDGLSTEATQIQARLTWHLAQRVDRFGNEMDVTYVPSLVASGAVNSILYPDTIKYTSNKNTGRAATKFVTFNWQSGTRPTVCAFPRGCVGAISNPQAIPKWQAGLATSNSFQLTGITMSAPNPVVPSTIGSYKFHYDTPSITGRPLLTRVQRCDGAGVCLEPTVFNWSSGSYNFQKFSTPVTKKTQYTDVTNGHFFPASVNVGDEGTPHLAAGDLNGDGRADLIYLAGAFPRVPTEYTVNYPRLWAALGTAEGLAAPGDTGLFTLASITASPLLPLELMPVNFADINDDGLTDLVTLGQNHNTAAYQWERYQGTLGTGGPFVQLPLGLSGTQMLDPTLNPDAINAGDYPATSVFDLSYLVADLNGDGLLDVAHAIVPHNPTEAPDSPIVCVPAKNPDPTQGPQLGVALNANGTPGQFATVPGGVQLGAMNIGCTGTPTLVQTNHVLTADLDGDGRSEIVVSQVSSAGTSLAATSLGVHGGVNGLSTIQTNIPGDATTTKILLDFNGDGLVDFMRVQSSTGNYPTRVPADLWENTGKGFRRHPLPGTPEGFDWQDAQVADINGDGLDDIFIASCGKLGKASTASPVALISDGFGNFLQMNLSDIAPAGILATPRSTSANSGRCNFVLLDMNGDGQLDLVQTESDSANLQGYLRKDPAPDRLIEVRNGLGADVQVQYSRFDGAGNTTCSYPYACSRRNVEVVSGYTVDNGTVLAGQPATTHYTMSYVGPRADAAGAGWLGFDSVTRQNDQTLGTDTKTYDLKTRIGGWYPFVGLPTNGSIEYSLSGAKRKILRSRTTSYQTIQSDPNNATGPYMVRPQTIVEQEFERTFSGSYNPANPQRSTHHTFGYDDLGNLTSHEAHNDITETDDNLVNIVTNNTASWLLNEVNSTTKTSTGSNGQIDQRSVGFQIDPGTGVTTGATINPGDPLQLTVGSKLNGDGLVTKVTATATSGETRTEQLGYDSIEGAWPASNTNALGQVTRSVYHCGLGVKTSSTDPNGLRTKWTVDGFGRVKQRIDPSGWSTAFVYTRPDGPVANIGSILTSTDSTGHVVRVTDDQLGRESLHVATAFDGVNLLAVTKFYDSVSRKIAFVSRPFTAPAVGPPMNPPGVGIRYVYDEMGRLTAATPSGEDSRTVTYQGLQATEFINGIERSVLTTDAAGRNTVSVDIEPTSTAPNQQIQTSYDYGPFSQLAHVYLPGGGGTTTIGYDHFGRRHELDDPDSGSHVTTYNAFGETMLQQSTGEADVVYTRDLLGRRTSTTQGTDVETFQWDTAAIGVGKLDTESTNSGVGKSFTYFSNGLLQTLTYTVDSQQFAFDSAYDGVGRLQTMTYPDTGTGTRFAVKLGYGPDSLLASVTDPATGTTHWQRTAAQADGQSSTEVFGDSMQTLFQEDPTTGRMASITTGIGAALDPVAQELTYGYNEDGTVKTRTDLLIGASGSSEGFTYDNLRRVKTWTQADGSMVTYGYSDSGNLTSRNQVSAGGTTTNETYVYGEHGAGPHAVTTGPLGSYGYDPSGRQVSRPGQPTLGYTYFNLPNQITNGDGSVVNFAYDAEGVRVKKTTATSEVLTMGNYERRTQSGAVTHVFYLPGPGRTAGQIECPAGGTCAPALYFHPDRLGTPDTVTQNADAVGHVKRDPFGRTYSTGAISIGSDVTVQFDGMNQDADLGLVNMNHRLYDPMTGRFISPDPLVKSVVDGQALNRYSFVRNNPLSFVDPTGLQEGEAENENENENENESEGEQSEEDQTIADSAATPSQSGPGADDAITATMKTDDGSFKTWSGYTAFQAASYSSRDGSLPGPVLTEPEGTVEVHPDGTVHFEMTPIELDLKAPATEPAQDPEVPTARSESAQSNLGPEGGGEPEDKASEAVERLGEAAHDVGTTLGIAADQQNINLWEWKESEGFGPSLQLNEHLPFEEYNNQAASARVATETADTNPLRSLEATKDFDRAIANVNVGLAWLRAMDSGDPVALLEGVVILAAAADGSVVAGVGLLTYGVATSQMEQEAEGWTRTGPTEYGGFWLPPADYGTDAYRERTQPPPQPVDIQ